MEEKTSSTVIKPRIANEKRRECLELFDKGFGYKRTARESGLNAYTVRDYLRRYKAKWKTVPMWTPSDIDLAR